MRGRARSCVLLVSAWALLGCSLMGLDDFGVTPCTSDSDCTAARSRLKPAGACDKGQAVCDEGLCRWQEAHEICNGKNDDCDDLVDEGLPLFGQMSGPAAGGQPSIGYASLSDARTFVAVANPDGSGHVLTLSPTAAETRTLRYSPCPSVVGAAANVPPLWNFAEVALAADEQNLVVASINTFGLASGKLQVGLSALGSSEFEIALGKPSDAPSGDDTDIPCGTVSGASALGVTRPAVASLGTRAGGAGALVAWLDAPTGSSAVPPALIPVEALGLIVPGGGRVWLDGTDQGMPKPLGYSTSLATPAVLALGWPPPLGQYLVAFPGKQDDQSGIQLVSLQINPGQKSLSFADQPQFQAVGAADQVSLALGDPERSEVGIAWSAGSGADAQVCFQIVSSSGELRSATAKCFATPAALFAPRLLHRQTGFAEEERRGGWFLSWLAAEGNAAPTFHVARLRDETLEDLGETVRAAVGIPLLYPNDDDWRVGYASTRLPVSDESQTETVPLWCQ